MKVTGYKCFNQDLTNQYGTSFSVGEIYVAPGIIKFGNNGNGFHMCKNMEDTFRYFDTTNKNICVCEVEGSGNICEFCDEYYGYYDMYCVEKLKIIRPLSREETINIALNLHEIRVKRFLSTFILDEKEIELFKNKYKNKRDILNIIAYYQEGDKDIFNNRYCLTKK